MDIAQRCGITIKTGEDPVLPGLGSVGKTFLFVASGQATVKGSRRTLTFHMRDLVSREIFHVSTFSAIISPYSHCLLTQEPLDHLTPADRNGPRSYTGIFQ